MRDYIIIHACGLEEYCDNKTAALQRAKAHSKDCELNEDEGVFVDESEDEELNGHYWIIKNSRIVKESN